MTAVVLAIIVAVVAIDALARFDPRARPKPREPSQKIVIDLRDRDQ